MYFANWLWLPLALCLVGAVTALAWRWPAVQTRLNITAAGWLLAVFPLAAFAWLLAALPMLSQEGFTLTVPWMPTLGLNAALYLDGWSALFGLLVSGIGAVVVVYAGYYFAGDPSAWRFLALILAFMTAMLGLVLAGDVITLFVFWEGTSIISFLLVGYKYKDEAARRGAYKALFITGGGGIALLGGLLLLAQVGGGAEWANLLKNGHAIQASPLYPVILGLIAFGAFTKSAQFPAHIWLPDAMSAPTPASAYLHSATMVKAGIYLMARLNPILGGTDTWFWLLGGFGAVTMLAGAYLGLKQNDLKALLAYSTVSQLGVLMGLIGQTTDIAFKALVVGTLAHALYKCALFLIAGIVDHETGTRDLRRLGGLGRVMRGSLAVAAIAGLSMAGLPPLFGFLAKETLLATAVHPNLPGFVSVLFPLFTVLAGAFILAQAGLLVYDTFLGQPRDPHLHAHEAPWGMLAMPAIPAVLSAALSLPLEPEPIEAFLALAAGAAFGSKVKVSLELFTGVNMPLILSVVAISLGGALFWQRERARAVMQGLWPQVSFNAVYEAAQNVIDWSARQATALQRGQIRFYLTIMLLATLALVAAFGGLPTRIWQIETLLAWPEAHGLLVFLRVASLAVAVGASLVSIVLTRDLYAIIGFGVSGLAVGAWMALEPAPDVALVQVIVDILATVILVLTLNLLPAKLRRKAQEASMNRTRLGLWRDALVALALGGIVFAVSLAALELRPHPSPASAYYAQFAKLYAGAKDMVGAVVVDFRALDTMLEVVVYAFAALGIYTIMHYTVRKANATDMLEPKEKRNPAGEPRGVFGLPTSPFLHLLAYALLPLTIILALINMLYGHDQPGDGFTAGVTLSLGIASWYIIFGYNAVKSQLAWLRPVRFIAWGLGLALVNALLGFVLGNGQQGQGFFAVVNYGNLLGLTPFLPNGITFSNALVFEIAICLVVAGASVLMLDNLGHPSEADDESNELLNQIGQK